MIVIICAKYKENPSRTVDATEWTRFSKSRPIDLEDIGQGQGSSHATHPLMLVIICIKYGKNPSWTIDATEWTQNAGRTDGRTDRRTDGRTNGRSETYPPTTSLCGGYNYIYEMDPTRTVGAKEWTRDARRIGWTDGQTDGWSETNIPPITSSCVGYNDSKAQQITNCLYHF